MKKRIKAFVASRLGSTRVPFKNVRMLNGVPMFFHLTQSALKSKYIDKLYLNTDSTEIVEMAKEHFGNAINYYLREPVLGTSAASLDDYVYDFVLKEDCDIVIFLNPCSPLLSAKTIDKAIVEFVNGNFSSMAASELLQTHSFLYDEPLNFSFSAKQPRSQDLPPVHCMTSGFFMWKVDEFKIFYEKFGYANFMSPFKSFGLNKIEALDIDNEEEWDLVEAFMSFQKNEATYHPNVSDAILNGLIKTN